MNSANRTRGRSNRAGSMNAAQTPSGETRSRIVGVRPCDVAVMLFELHPAFGNMVADAEAGLILQSLQQGHDCDESGWYIRPPFFMWASSQSANESLCCAKDMIPCLSAFLLGNVNR